LFIVASNLRLYGFSHFGDNLPAMTKTSPFLLGALLWLSARGLFAGTDAAPAQATPPPDIWQQANLTGNWDGLRDKLHDDGADFFAQYTSEALGNPYGGNFGQGAIYEGLLETRVSFDFEKMTGGAWTGATFRASSYWTHGPSLTQNDVGDFSTISNIDAYDTVRLHELWLQQNLLDDKISLEVGQLVVDSEFFISPCALLFLNGTFGAFPLVTYGFQPFNPPIYPLTSTGVRLKLQPIDSVYFMTAVYNGNAGTQPGNNEGTRFGFSAQTGILSFSELGYLLNQGKDDKGMPGIYKLGGWVHTANFSTWSSQAAFANGTGSLQSAGVGYGIYGVADQTIWRRDATAASDPQSLCVCLRTGTAPSRSSMVDFDIDAGLNFFGLIPGRKDDVAGLGIARSAISHDFSDFSQATGGPAFKYEAVIEGTYSLNVTPWWQLQPDVQYIFSAGAQAHSPDALVIGLRSTVTF
jgi:porin